MSWIWWAAATGLLVLLEAFTGTLACAMLAVGAAVGTVLAALGAPLWAQVGVFAVVSVGLVGLVTPSVVRRQNRRPPLRIGAKALVGTTGVVTSRVDGRTGRVLLNHHQTWTARALDPEAVFEEGDEVHVAQIDGATAVVM
jgi:membrane protein implicated in regulation of membrane protease activity